MIKPLLLGCFEVLQDNDDMCLNGATRSETLITFLSAANHNVSFFSQTERERGGFTFLGTITLVLLCQPKTIKP